MWALKSSPRLSFRLRRKHRVNCHILAAIQATFPTRRGGVNFDFARSQSCCVMIVMLQVASVSMTIGMVIVRSILGRGGSSAQMC